MKTKKIITLILALATFSFALTSCSSKNQSSTSSQSSKTSAASQATQKITLGVVGTDKEFWVPAQKTLKSEGIDLEFVEFSDYVTPNKALANKEIDLNAFQHQVYLDSEVAANGYKIQAIGYTLIAPLNLYSKKIDSVSKLKAGDVIAVPNDATNEGRALKVLEHAGIIKLKANAPFSPTVQDIDKYNVKITIKELAANTITSALPDVAAAIINGNYATAFGLKNDDAIYKDDGTGSEKYWNIIVARTEDLNNPDRVKIFKKIVNAFHQSATEDVFKTTFKGAYIKAGWDIDLLKDK